jgi:hypothetical protein
MKFKKLISILLFFTLTNSIFGQGVEGEWYTPLRNKLLHISISKDSINFRKCSFDKNMVDYGYVDLACKIEKYENEAYIVSSIKDSIKTFSVFYFQLIDNKNYMNIESSDKKFKTISDAENETSNLKKQIIYITLLNNKQLEKIRKQKDIKKMTTIDFKNYASKIILSDSLYRQNITEKFMFSYLYSESTSRILLSEIGINSLVKGNVFDESIFKFADIAETKEIFIKLTERK